MGEDSSKTILVRVALCIRPLDPKEHTEGCAQSIDVVSESPQVVASGTEKAFMYDFAYPAQTTPITIPYLLKVSSGTYLRATM